MKTSVYGMCCFIISVFSIVIVCQVCLANHRVNNLQDNLQEAMESSLNAAMSDRSYSIDTSEELIADVVEGIVVYLDNNAALDVNVKEADVTTGLLSIEVIEHYPTAAGKMQDIKCERTILLEHYSNNLPGSHEITYVVKATDGSGNDVVYKQYTLKESATMIVPKNPTIAGYRFDGWMLDGTSNVLSSTNIKALAIDKDYKFVAKMTKL